MPLRSWLVACIAIFAATPAVAQSSSAKPLNLNLPLQFSAAPASTTHGSKQSLQASKPRQNRTQPGDTRYADLPPPYAFPPGCNNEAYKKPHVFGSATVGAFAGSHIEGNSQATTVSIAKALGSCNHPSGGIIFNFGFSRQTINGSGWPPYREP